MNLNKLDKCLGAIYICSGLIFIYLGYHVLDLPVEIIVTVIFVGNMLVALYRYARKYIKEKKYK